MQQLSIIPNPEAAYELCNSYVPDCDKALPRSEEEIRQEQQSDQQAGYRGMSEDELLNREGVSPQEYLEFTERIEEVPPPVPEQPEEDQFNYFSVAGEPGLRGEPGVGGLEPGLKNQGLIYIHGIFYRNLGQGALQVPKEKKEGMALMEWMVSLVHPEMSSSSLLTLVLPRVQTTPCRK